jgi:hypothetical protein
MKIKLSHIRYITPILIIALFFLPSITHANLITDVWDIVRDPLGTLKGAFLKILSDAILPLVTNVMSFQNFFTDGVNAGWKATRDFANLFFALILLFIAIATVLNTGGLDNYTAKRMLPKFIFAALFINFSKAIVGFLIDISQIIMISLYNSFGPTLTDSIASASKIAEAGAETNLIDSNIINLFTIILVIILIFVLLWTSLILAMRIVTLWFVIMLSPLAFVSGLIPPLSSLSNSWKNMLSQALITGPTLMFLLYLAVTVMNASIGGNSEGGNLLNNGNLLNYVLVIGLLFLANIEAMKAGQSAPPILKNAVGVAGTVATFGLGAYVGAGGSGTGKMFGKGRELVQGGVKNTDKLVGGLTNTAGAVGGATGIKALQNANQKFESKKRDLIEEQKTGVLGGKRFGAAIQGFSAEGKKLQLEDFELEKAKELAAQGKVDEKGNERYKKIFNADLAKQSKELNDEGKDILELRTQLHKAIKEDNLALQQSTMLQIAKIGQLGQLSSFNPNASNEENAFFADIAKNNATEGAMTDELVSRIKPKNAGIKYDNSSVARNFRANLKTVGQDKKGQASFVSDITNPGYARANPNSLSDKIIGSGLVEGIAEINKNPNAFRQREPDPSGGFKVDGSGKPTFIPYASQILNFINKQRSIDTLKDPKTWNRLNDASAAEFLTVLNAAPRNTNIDAAIQGLTK